MADEITAGPESEPAPRVPVSSGRWLAALALLTALVAVFGIAWLYYTLMMHSPAAGMAERLTGLGAEQARLRTGLERLAEERQRAFEAFRTDLEERQRVSVNELAESLGGRAAATASPQREWQFAEVEFLLRAANHRAIYEGDAGSAIGLLRSADGILSEMGGPAAFGVRSTIASEILSLEQANTVDPSEIYLRLDAVKRSLAGLTLARPEYAETAPASATVPREETAAAPADGDGNPVPAAGRAMQTGTEPAGPAPGLTERTLEDTPGQEARSTAPATEAREERGFLATLGRELGRLIRFRRFDTALERPPAPAESDLLEINLRLMLEQAQLAALKRNQAVYAASMDAALEWARALLDGRDSRVPETIESLEALRHLDLETPLPDISGSLNQLPARIRHQLPAADARALSGVREGVPLAERALSGVREGVPLAERAFSGVREGIPLAGSPQRGARGGTPRRKSVSGVREGAPHARKRVGDGSGLEARRETP